MQKETLLDMDMDTDMDRYGYVADQRFLVQTKDTASGDELVDGSSTKLISGIW